MDAFLENAPAYLLIGFFIFIGAMLCIMFVLKMATALLYIAYALIQSYNRMDNAICGLLRFFGVSLPSPPATHSSHPEAARECRPKTFRPAAQE
ncbi:MAG: hypothetical protein LBB60_11005 [Desulfovibrio sp.]|nr:hypothetical protein [Desulfovibrio sp.]